MKTRLKYCQEVAIILPYFDLIRASWIKQPAMLMDLEYKVCGIYKATAKLDYTLYLLKELCRWSILVCMLLTEKLIYMIRKGKIFWEIIDRMVAKIRFYDFRFRLICIPTYRKMTALLKAFDWYILWLRLTSVTRTLRFLLVTLFCIRITRLLR